MKVGDLVIRKIPNRRDAGNPSHAAAVNQRNDLGSGLVLSTQTGGRNPSHPCLTVYYPKVGKTYDIAESLMEVISKI